MLPLNRSGIVLTLSVNEIRSYPRFTVAKRQTGYLGIIAALLAGACPCYYLVPLLAVAGGTGGFLATLGVLFSNYQMQLKLGSIVLLLFTTFTQERSLRAACKLPARPTAGALHAE